MTPSAWWLTVSMSFLTDFVISGGGALVAAMTVNQAVGLPSEAAILVSVVTGLMAGARSIQKLLAAPPTVTKP